MLYYSHVNEDNLVERRLAQAFEPDYLVTITGSGERVMSLLDVPSVKEVVAVDFNAAAQFLLELKLTALKAFSTKDYLAFVGAKSSSQDRWAMYQQLEGQLSEAARAYWKKHPSDLRKGILNIGHFERFLKRIRPLLKLYLGKQFYRQFSSDLPLNGSFPKWRWKLLKGLFSSRLTFQMMGMKDVAFINPDCDTSLIGKGFQEVIDEQLVRRSFMMNLVFNGHLDWMDARSLPPSLTTKVLDDTKERLGNQISLRYLCDDFKEAVNQLEFPKHSRIFFSLSDMLSFTQFEYLKEVVAHLKAQGYENIQMVIRSFLRNRMGAEKLQELRRLGVELTDHSEEERSKMYKVYSIRFIPNTIDD
ncbi:MAG: DUF3419 family protein [Bacteroidota bacterium]